MNQKDLPICAHRGERMANDKFPCRSSKLIVSGEGVSDDICLICPYVNQGEPIEERSFSQKAATFTNALMRWLAAGRPRTTPEQRADREGLCRACPLFDGVKIACKACGCPGNTESMAFGLVEKPGKWDMATERCPLGTDRLHEPYRSMPPRWLETV
ncbi:MAG TPA: hypothetical protein VK395_22190 [Gemmataceae bacterium]|nr:hypothetical protein [Gemmataceae bacterium]